MEEQAWLPSTSWTSDTFCSHVTGATVALGGPCNCHVPFTDEKSWEVLTIVMSPSQMRRGLVTQPRSYDWYVAEPSSKLRLSGHSYS